MKSLKDSKGDHVSIWSIICMLLVVALVYLSTGGIWKNSSSNFQEVKKDVLSPEQGIEMDLKNIDVKVCLIESDEVEVIQSSNADEKEEIVEVQQNGNQIVIKSKTSSDKGSWSLLGIDDWRKKSKGQIEVKVPKSFRGTLDIKTSSGEVNIEDELILPSLCIATSSGDISLGEIQSESQLQTTSGKILVNKLIGKSHQLETTSGEISINEIEGQWEMHTTSGAIELGKLKGYGKGKSTSGEISINQFTLTGDVDLKTVSGEVTLNFSSDSSATITMQSTSGELNGDVPIDYTNQKGNKGIANIGTGKDHEVQIKTVSGEICINQES